MHVDGLEAGAVECGRHLDLAVDALLAQDRDAGSGADVDEGRSHILARVERQLRPQPRRVEVARRSAFLVGAFGVVAQRLQRMAGRPPRVEQLVPAPLRQRAAIVAHADRRRGGGLGDALRAVDQAMARDQIGKLGAVLAGDLHDRAELLVEQRAERILAPAVEADVETQPRAERHLAQGRERAAVGTVVVGQQQPGLPRVADQFEEIPQPLRVVEIGHAEVAALGGLAGERRQRAVGVAGAIGGPRFNGVRMALREHRAAEALLAGAQADQPQLGVAVARQQRRELLAHVDHRRERGDDQRDRRDRRVRLDRSVAVARLPLRLHRQRILAHRDAQFERRAQRQADGLDRIEQQRVLARMRRGRHPVRRQLDAVERLDRRGAQVRDRLADRHPCGGSGIEQC